MCRVFIKFITLYAMVFLISCQNGEKNLFLPDSKPVVLSIISPANDSHFSYGDEIQFQLELKNNFLEIQFICWTSNTDSIFGNEFQFNYDRLSPGLHSIVVDVLFSDSSQIETSISLTVHHRNENAIVKIIPPQLDSLWFYQTENYTFLSQITDSVGRDLNAHDVNWVSDHDGVVSTNNFLMTGQFSVNTHSLKLQVTFADNSISEDTISNIRIITDPWSHTDLFNDREMESPEDPDAPYVRDAWSDWIKENSIPVRSLSSNDYSDLSFLDPFMKDKDIVQMGEVAHGIAEQNRGRVRLIKYLHQNHHFNVIAFESGFYDCYYSNKNIETTSDREVLKNSLYNMWHTTDLLNLFSYIKESQQTDNPLYLCGFDIRPTGNARLTRPAFFKEIVSKLDTIFAEEIAKEDSILVKWILGQTGIDDYIMENYEVLVMMYDRLISLLSENENLLLDDYDMETIQVALQSAQSIRVNIDQRNTTKFESRHRSFIRDQQMFEHFRYIKETLYPGKKYIIWSHNYHIQNDPEPVGYTKTLGYWLDQHYSDELYTIWSLSYRGTINYGVIDEIKTTQNESVEAILYQARKKYFFIDISQQQQSPATSWMFVPVLQQYLHGTGAYDIRYIPRDQYDAIFFIDTASQPVYIY